MPVMNNDGEIFDERRKTVRRKSDGLRRKKDKDMILERREDVKDRRIGEERRKKDINA